MSGEAQWPQSPVPARDRSEIAALKLSLRFMGSLVGNCRRGGSNPYTFRYRILSPARLPIPPLLRRSAACCFSAARVGYPRPVCSAFRPFVILRRRGWESSHAVGNTPDPAGVATARIISPISPKQGIEKQVALERYSR